MCKKLITKLCYAALLGAMVFVGTQFLKIPLAFGYFNMGDCFVLLSGWLLNGSYAIATSSIGAVLADILSGYAVYAPVTLVLKALMALIAHIVCSFAQKRNRSLMMVGYTVSALVAELLMTAGYYLFEGCLYGFSAAIVAVPGNLIQGAAAVIVSLILIGALERAGIASKIRSSI